MTSAAPSYDFSKYDYLFETPSPRQATPAAPLPEYSYPKAGLAVAGGSAVGAIPKLGGMFVSGLSRQIPEGFVEDVLEMGISPEERQSLLAELQARQRGERTPEFAQRAMQVGPELTSRLREMLGTAPPETPAQRVYEAGIGAGAEVGTLAGLGGIGAGAALGEAGLGALSGAASQTAAEAGLPKWAQFFFGLTPYFGRALFKKLPVADQATLEGVRARTGLGTLDPAIAEPIPRSALARDLQAAARAERAATAAPLREAYDRWTRSLQDKQVMIPQKDLQTLARNHEKIVSTIKKGAKADQELAALLQAEAAPGYGRSVGQVIEEMQPLQRGAVPKWRSAEDLNAYRLAIQAILNRQKKMVGKPELLFGPQKDKVEKLLSQVEGWQDLKATDAAWANMKRRFDENPTVKKWFEGDINPEDVLSAVKTGTEAEHLMAALPEAKQAEFRQYIKDQITRQDPKKALMDLRDKEEFKTILGPEYKQFRAEMVEAVRDAPRLRRAVAATEKFLGSKWVSALTAISGGIEGLATKEGLLAALRTAAEKLPPSRARRFERLISDPSVLRALQVQVSREADQQAAQPSATPERRQSAEVRLPQRLKALDKYDHLFSR